ncbi:hypothetical protein N7463_007431 [Penicillium fimorum]|uniref:Xylanolytic transcriptional activator regulatory domain-containing protein n=1 Tax=Penicillium fimorum TaxID=1882269 RepID=A0A9W9XWA5_9EURO|nr:hypothetical protein N7463_007431 [Penicillium fimorum]
MLLESFLLSVKPLFPLVYVPTLLDNYEGIWEQGVTKSRANQGRGGIQVQDSGVFIKQLKLMLERTLVLSHYTELPTLNGLITVLLAWECDPTTNDILAAPAFVSQAMHVARTMGLHQEEAIVSRGVVEAELARRVWYYIIFLELYACIASGSTLSYGTQESSYSTQLP